MTIATIRKELHTYIDTLPDKSIKALRPLFSVIADTGQTLVIEANLTAEEKAAVKAGRKAYAKNPASFITLDALKKEIQQNSPGVRKG